MRTLRLLLGAACALILTAGLARAELHHVEIHDFEFIPATLQIAVGDTVHWMNMGDMPHTVDQTPEAGSCEDLPGGFLSGTLNPGDEFLWAFGAPGNVYYHCEFHCPPMTAEIEVVDPTPAESPTWARIKGLFR
jgi:plastocyanin